MVGPIADDDLSAATEQLVEGHWADAAAAARAGLRAHPEDAVAWRTILAIAAREQATLPEEPDPPFPRFVLGFDLGTPTQVRVGYDFHALAFGLAAGDVLVVHGATGRVPAWHAAVEETAWVDLPIARVPIAFELDVGALEDPQFKAETGIGLRVVHGPLSALAGIHLWSAGDFPVYPALAMGGMW